MSVKFYLVPGVRNRKFYLAPGMRNEKIYLAPNDSFEKFYLAVKWLKVGRFVLSLLRQVGTRNIRLQIGTVPTNSEWVAALLLN